MQAITLALVLTLCLVHSSLEQSDVIANSTLRPWDEEKENSTTPDIRSLPYQSPGNAAIYGNGLVGQSGFGPQPMQPANFQSTHPFGLAPIGAVAPVPQFGPFAYPQGYVPSHRPAPSYVRWPGQNGPQFSPIQMQQPGAYAGIQTVQFVQPNPYFGPAVIPYGLSSPLAIPYPGPLQPAPLHPAQFPNPQPVEDKNSDIRNHEINHVPIGPLLANDPGVSYVYPAKGPLPPFHYASPKGSAIGGVYGSSFPESHGQVKGNW